MIGLSRAGRAGIVGLVLTFGPLVPGPAASVTPGPAAPDAPPDTIGHWTEPFGEGVRSGENGPAATSGVLPLRTSVAEERPKLERVSAGGDPPADDQLTGPVAAAVLRDGRILYLDDHGARVLDLRSGAPRFTTPRGGGGLRSADLTALPGGKVLLVGGAAGEGNARLFDPATDAFAPAAAMRHGRWGAQLAIGPDGRPTVFGGVTPVVGDAPLSSVRRPETYDPVRNTWQEHEAENELPLEPRIVLALDGRFFYAAAGQTWEPFGQSPDEATTALFQFFDPKTRKWQVSGAAPFGARSGAFVVPLTLEPPFERMTVLTGGGVPGPAPGPGLPANPLVTLTAIDADGHVASEETGRLQHARWYASGVLLPDGKVLAAGGSDRDDAAAPGTARPVNIPELYDPAAGTWAEVAPHARPRGYHHSALLLPDMRVLIGGRDATFEVWSPPYLFRGPRPAIETAPAAVRYRETFDITTPDAGLVESVVLLRTPSPGHGNDSDQRALRLEFTRRTAHLLTATGPPSGTVAPPGLYYLVVNRRSLQGPVPSVARIVEVGP